MLTPEELLAPAARAFRPLRREEYDQLVAAGSFEGEKIELLEGMLVPMSPQGAPHAKVIQRLNMHFTALVRGRAEVRVQSPVAASDTSEPEPDLALVPVDDDYEDHPSTAVLLIEVADSSVGRDLGAKASIYARAGFPELWVVDLRRRRTVVHRAPEGGRYASITEVGFDVELSVAALPDVSLRLADLIPRS